MAFAYQDILDRERPVHGYDAFGRAHPRMPRAKRAKIFAPYAALRGFDEAIRAEEARSASRYEPEAGGEYALHADEIG